MNYRPRHFLLQELVPREVFDARGNGAWELLDARALITADALRDKFGVCVVNDWHEDGRFNESGFRDSASSTGAKYSQHRYGRGLDCKFAKATPREVFDYLRAHAEDFPYLTTLEDVEATPTWLHFDVRNNFTPGIRIVKP